MAPSGGASGSRHPRRGIRDATSVDFDPTRELPAVAKRFPQDGANARGTAYPIVDGARTIGMVALVTVDPARHAFRGERDRLAEELVARVSIWCENEDAATGNAPGR